MGGTPEEEYEHEEPKSFKEKFAKLNFSML